MKNFEAILNQTYTFGNCNICDARCCDGNRGSTFSQLILADFEVVYKNFPIVFLLGELGYLKPVVILSNGRGFCRYIQDMKCVIYDERPSVCKLYPLSPHLDNKTYIDTTCPALNELGNPITKEGVVQKDFFHKSLIDYQGKYIDTHNHFEQFNKKENLDKALTINTNTFYKFKKDFDDEFIKMHLESLHHIDDYFIN